MIKCCIFDLDGTLLDTIGTITYYVNETLKDFDFPPISVDECKRFVGNGPKDLIKRVMNSKNYEDESGIAEILSAYKEKYAIDPYYLTAPYDGITEMLDALFDKGILLAVISNKQNEAVVPCVKHFFGERFALSRGSMPDVPLKPAPDAVYKIMDELGVRPDEVVYVGDSEVDMQTGKAFCAAKTVGVAWGFRDADVLWANGADRVVSTAEELCSEVLA